MNKQQYLDNKNKPQRYKDGVAGSICGKCGFSMTGQQSRGIVFHVDVERIIKAKYTHLCDKCRRDYKK